MKVTELAFIGYPVTDWERARHFYEKVLKLTALDSGHEISGMPGKMWIEYELGSATLAISNAWEPSGQSGPSAALEVEDFDTAVAWLKQEGVLFVADRIETPVCHFALICDPDGNAITIHKRKKT